MPKTGERALLRRVYGAGNPRQNIENKDDIFCELIRDDEGEERVGEACYCKPDNCFDPDKDWAYAVDFERNGGPLFAKTEEGTGRNGGLRKRDGLNFLVCGVVLLYF